MGLLEPSASSHESERPILFVSHTNHAFTNRTVNQRLRALLELAGVTVLSCFPTSFPDDIAQRAEIIGLPLSSRLPEGVAKLSAFTLEVSVWVALSSVRQRGRAIVYCFQDTSALAGLIARSRCRGWVIDAVDDPAMELANATQRRKSVKALSLGIRDSVMRRLLPKADLVCTIGSAPSDPLPRLLAEHYHVEKPRILALNQAIDVPTVAEVSEHDDPGAGGVDKPSALFVGFVSPLRGVDVLLDASRLLRERGIDVVVRLIGHLKAYDKAWLDQAIEESEGAVQYLGVLPSQETLREMSACTVGVLPFPDRREMRPVQPVTGLEYLALGKPIVASRLPGMPSLVEHGVNGLLVRPSSPRELADALGELVVAASSVAAMGAASRARADEFDVADVNARLARRLRPWL